MERSPTNYEAALDHAMHILQTDRKFRDDIGRATLVRIFALLPKGSELAKNLSAPHVRPDALSESLSYASMGAVPRLH